MILDLQQGPHPGSHFGLHRHPGDPSFTRMPAPPDLLRLLVGSLLAAAATGLVSCRSASQKMDLSPDMIATPSHRMAQSEYPFDSDGRYIDAWAAQGAGRFGRVMNTDSTDEGRERQAAPERRPLPPPRETASTPPPPIPQRPTATATRPPLNQRAQSGESTRTSPTAAENAKPTAAPAKTPAKTPAKPPVKKPPAKKKTTTHTVKRGDSLSSLSSRYGVSVQALKKANNLKSERIIDGRKLVIPKN